VRDGENLGGLRPARRQQFIQELQANEIQLSVNIERFASQSTPEILGKFPSLIIKLNISYGVSLNGYLPGRSMLFEQR